MNTVVLRFCLVFNLKCAVYPGNDVWKEIFLFPFALWIPPNPLAVFSANFYSGLLPLSHVFSTSSFYRIIPVSISNV